MRKLIIVLSILLFSLVLAALTSCGGDSGGGGGSSDGDGGSDEEAVREVLNDELDAVHRDDVDDYYELFSPEVRAICSFEDLEAAAEADDSDQSKIDFSNVDVRVEGDTAYVSYTITDDGEVIDAVTADDPEVFVKIDGRWYDDQDPCP